MRHNLVVSYCLSILILATVLFISILAGPPRNTIFYRGSLGAENFTPAFSENVYGDNLLNLFGAPKFTMILLVGTGFLLHLIFLYKLMKFRKLPKKARISYPMYWGVLFVPYVLLLIFTL